MIRICVVGGIGSGKSHVAKSFGFPVFNADLEVAKIYQTNKKCFKKIKRILPLYFSSFPIKKKEVGKSIIADQNNLKKIIKIIHPEVRKRMNRFLNKHKYKKFVILDVPLLLENKIDKKNDILIFVDAKKNQILKKLKKRKNFNSKLFTKFKKIQFSLEYKRKKSKFILKNNFTNELLRKNIKIIFKKIKNDRSSIRY
jgi:dephospho-CoA kinase